MERVAAPAEAVGTVAAMAAARPANTRASFIGKPLQPGWLRSFTQFGRLAMARVANACHYQKDVTSLIYRTLHYRHDLDISKPYRTTRGCKMNQMTNFLRQVVTGRPAPRAWQLTVLDAEQVTPQVRTVTFTAPDLGEMTW